MSARVLEYRRGRSPEVLADIADGSVACVLTDPPYGTLRGKNDGYGRRRQDGTRRTIANDGDLAELTACAPSVARVLAADGVALVFMAPTQYRAACAILEAFGLRAWHSLPWDKGAPGISYSARFAYEDCILATHPDYDPWESRGALVLPIRVPRIQNPEHPNEKPVKLLRRLLAWACPDGGLVADYFAGIGSGGIAAHAQGCDWIGAEVDEQWWPVAERRIAEVTDQPHPESNPSLFGAA